MQQIFTNILVSCIIMLLLLNLYIFWSIKRVFTKGQDVNRMTKSLILALGGLIGARLARAGIKRLIK
jgi:hypothetical protein